MATAPAAAAIQPASSADLPDVLHLLRASNLPTAGVEELFPCGFMVSRDEAGALAAVAGVGRALLHSGY